MKLIKFIERLKKPRIVGGILSVILIIEIGRTFYPTITLYILSRILLFYFILFAYSEAKKTKQVKAYIILILLFALWALVTTIWSLEPMATLPRSLYFAYVAVAASIAGYLWYGNFSKSFLGFLLPSNIIIAAISLFSLITNLPSDAWTGGCGIGLKGFAPHQNVLGMMILLTSPAVLFSSLKILNVKFQRSEIINFNFVQSTPLLSVSYLLLLLLNVYLLILTQSRASVISVFLMVAVFLVLKINWKVLIVSGLILFIAISILFFISPKVKTSVVDYIYKTEKEIGDRRTSQLAATISAAKHGGLIGLGYGISDPQNILPGIVPEGKRYYREKMVSILALIEEVGVIGLALFLAIIGYVFWKLGRRISWNKIRSIGKAVSNSTEVAAMFSVLVGLCFHAQIEGWWLGAGSWQFVLFFTIIGYSIATSTNSSTYIKIKNENAKKFN